MFVTPVLQLSMVNEIEYRVDGDVVTVEEGPFTSAEDARYMISNLNTVVPCDRLDLAAFSVACAVNKMVFEVVTVEATRVRVTGQETDAELFVETFEAVRETWIKRRPAHAVRPRALAATGS